VQVAPSVADYVRAKVQSARKQERISDCFFLQRVVVNIFDFVAPFDARFHLRTEQGRVLDTGKASLLSSCVCCSWLQVHSMVHSSIACVNPCARSAHGFTQAMLECIRSQLQQAQELSRQAEPI